MTTTKDFLATLFSRAPVDSFIEFRAIGNGPTRRFFWPVEDLRELVIPDPGANALFGVLPRLRKSGKARDVALGACVWVDLDGPALRPWKHAPTAVIETSPGKLQAYWLLREPLDLAQIENLNRRLARYYGGDPNCCDRARVMRLPGFANLKYDSEPMVRLLECDPDRVYSLGALTENLPAAENYVHQKPVASQKSGEPTCTPTVALTEEEVAHASFLGLWEGLGVTLRPGNNLYTCMFHQDSNPSLSIHRENEVFHCFGCGVGGGLGALRWLAAYGPIDDDEDEERETDDGVHHPGFLDELCTPSSVSRKVSEWREIMELDSWALEDGSGVSWAQKHRLCLIPKGARGECIEGHQTLKARPCSDSFDERCLPQSLYRLRTTNDLTHPGHRQLMDALGDNVKLWAFSRSFPRPELASTQGARLKRAREQLTNAVSRCFKEQSVHHFAERINITEGTVKATKYVLAGGDTSVGRRKGAELVQQGHPYIVVHEYLRLAGGSWTIDLVTREEAEVLLNTLDDCHRAGGLKGFSKVLKWAVSAQEHDACEVCKLPWYYAGWLTSEYVAVELELPNGRRYWSWAHAPPKARPAGSPMIGA